MAGIVYNSNNIDCYQNQMKKVVIKEQQNIRESEKQSIEDSEQLKDQPTELQFIPKIKKKEAMFINYQGMFESAHFSYNHSLSLIYTAVASQGWKLVHGQKTGMSQHAAQNDQYLVWNFPFQIMYEIKSPSGWPQMVLVIYGKDYFGRSIAKGYGNFHLPSSPGSHIRKVKMFEVLPPSNTATFCALLMGYINQLKQPQQVLLSQEGGREYLRTKPMGQVTVKVQVRRYNFQKYGYQ